MRKKLWQESSSGPDWVDVVMLAKAIETMHGVNVVIGLVATPFTGPLFETHISAVKHESPASVVGAPVLDTRGAWPCPEHKTLQACIFDGLYKLDFAISKQFYSQENMWEAEG